MGISLGLNLVPQAFFHLITHAVSKALLFICVGYQMMRVSHHQDFRLLNSTSLRGLVIKRRAMFAGLSLSGIVFINGFFSKERILENPLPLSKTVALAIILFIVLFRLYYTFRILSLLFSRVSPSTPHPMCESFSLASVLPLLTLRVTLG